MHTSAMRNDPSRMGLPAFLGAMRPSTGRAERIRSVPSQLLRPAPTDLVRSLVEALNECVRPAAFLETEADFSLHVETHIESFVALTTALSTQIHPSAEPPPRLAIGQRLVELLGGGADTELEFCEYTLWSALLRASKGSPESQVKSIPLFDTAIVGVFAWAILGAGGRAEGAHPVAMRAALGLFRESALQTHALVAEVAGPHEGDAPELEVATFDAEDAFLAADPGA